jgi:hypothetical protein
MHLTNSDYIKVFHILLYSLKFPETSYSLPKSEISIRYNFKNVSTLQKLKFQLTFYK